MDFNRDWSDYRDGFGNITLEHWLGNEKINRMSAQGEYELRIDLADFDGNERYAKYDNFRLGDADTNYNLYLGKYRGDAGKLLFFYGRIMLSESAMFTATWLQVSGCRHLFLEK